MKTTQEIAAFFEGKPKDPAEICRGGYCHLCPFYGWHNEIKHENCLAFLRIFKTIIEGK